MVSAICPLCKIILVEAEQRHRQRLYIAEEKAAISLGAKYVSNSWGGPESSSDTTYDCDYYGHPAWSTPLRPVTPLTAAA